MANAPLGVVLRHIHTLVDAESFAAETDGQLLERFTARRDESAFASLMRRHGPMVLGVCRRVLPRVHDTEDVFQATFLLLARKAGSIRKQESVGSWLHGVAYRLAVAAKTQAARRQANERRAANMRNTESRPDATWEELKAVLDDGLQRLPEKYRTALVLSYLEGKTHEEAAGQLGCPLATFRNWVARGRRLLRNQLVRRGLSLSAASLTTALIENAAPAAVPATLLKPTLSSALQFAAGTKAAAIVSPPVAALVEGGLKAMLVSKLKLATVLTLALGMLTAGAGFSAHHRLFGKAAEEEPAQTAEPLGEVVGRIANPSYSTDRPQGEKSEQARLDSYGDPVPQGAIKRVGTLRFRLGGGAVTDLFLGAGGKTLISNTYHGAGAVQVWESATGKLIRSFPGNFAAEPIAVTTDGSMLAIPEGAKIGLWDASSGQRIRRLEAENVAGVHALAFSPDGQTLASSDQGGVLHFWYPATGQHASQHATGRTEEIAWLAYSPDGKILASGTQWGISLQLWDAASHRLLYQISRPGRTQGAFAFSPDGALLAAGAADSPVALWEVRTGRLVRQFRGLPYADALAFSPDGKTLATNEIANHLHSPIVSLWDVTTGKQLRRITIPANVPNVILFSLDGKKMFTGSGWGGIIESYDVATGKPVGPAVEAPSRVHDLTMSPGVGILAYCKDYNVQLHDLSSGRDSDLVLPAGQGFKTLAFSSDGLRIASLSNRNQPCVWDVQSQKLVHRLDQPSTKSKQWALASALSPDGKVLATLRSDGVVQLWDPQSGQKLRQLDFRGNYRTFRAMNHRHDGGAIAFSPDGSLLAASGGAFATGETRVRIWDVATWNALPALTAVMNAPTGETPKQVFSGAFLGSWEMSIVPRIVFAPDGRTLALNRWQKTIPVWEVASGKERLLLEGHQESTVWVAYAPDGRTLASAGWDKTIRLWDLETGRELRCLTGHRGKANSLAFTADGNTLISAGDDSTILYWDVAAQMHRPVLTSRPVTVKEIESLWNDLADPNAGKAYRTMISLWSSPAESITLLARHLQPATSVDLHRMNGLMADLDSKSFAVRSKATADLEQLDDLGVAALKKKLAENPSPEVRQRIKTILKSAEPWRSPALLRQIRAVEVLEKIGTPPARQLLQKLAAGAPAARLTKEAASAVGRLGKVN